MASSSAQGEGQVYKLRAVLQVKHSNAQCSSFNNTIIIMSTAGSQHGREAGGRGDGAGRGSAHRQQGQECQVNRIQFHLIPIIQLA